MFNLLIRLKIIHIYDLPQIRVDYSILVFFLQCKVSHTKPSDSTQGNGEPTSWTSFPPSSYSSQTNLLQAADP